jgi:hypothetical protein
MFAVLVVAAALLCELTGFLLSCCGFRAGGTCVLSLLLLFVATQMLNLNLLLLAAV